MWNSYNILIFTILTTFQNCWILWFFLLLTIFLVGTVKITTLYKPSELSHETPVLQYVFVPPGTKFEQTVSQKSAYSWQSLIFLVFHHSKFISIQNWNSYFRSVQNVWGGKFEDSGKLKVLLCFEGHIWVKIIEGAHLRILANSMFRRGTIKSNPKVFAKKRA